LIILAYWVFLVLPSQDSSVLVYRFKWWTPLLIIGLFVWLFYELRQARKDHRFSVTLSEDGIQIGEDFKPWNQIQRAEIKFALGRAPAIILYTNSGELMKIPAMIEARGYIEGLVERYVKDILKPQG
jgi:hypothetical protein